MWGDWWSRSREFESRHRIPNRFVTSVVKLCCLKRPKTILKRGGLCLRYIYQYLPISTLSSFEWLVLIKSECGWLEPVWPDFNFRPFTTMKICTIAKFNCQSKFKVLPSTNKPDQNCPRLLKFYQSGKISPNLVTLARANKFFHK